MKVPESETDFVAPNSYSLAEAFVEGELIPRAIYEGDQLVGFIMYGKWLGTDSYWITRLFISPDFRGRGIAREAIQLAIRELFSDDDCDRVSISFVRQNHSARALYESLGFRETGMIEDEIKYEYLRSST